MSFYARYDYREVTPPDFSHPRVVIFEREPSAMFRPILISSDYPAITYGRPVILHAGGRVVLHIPANESGTAQLNHEIMYVWAQDGWRDVDVTSWLRDLDHRLSQGLGVRKGDLSRLCEDDSLDSAVAEQRGTVSDRRPRQHRPAVARREYASALSLTSRSAAARGILLGVSPVQRLKARTSAAGSV